jgi:hypothetical protein
MQAVVIVTEKRDQSRAHGIAVGAAVSVGAIVALGTDDGRSRWIIRSFFYS